MNMKRMNLVVLLVFAGIGAVCLGENAPPKSPIAALVDKMPAFGPDSMFEGPPRAEAEKVFDQVLAGGAPGVVAVVDMVVPPGDVDNFKPRYVLHAMAQWLCEAKLADKRRLFVDALCSTLGTARPAWVQGFVARQLQVVGDAKAAPALGRLLGDEENCEYAVQALSAIGGPEAAGELRKALPAARGKTRMTIIRGLGEVRDTASAGELVKALADADRDVRITAALALAQIADPKTGDAMLKAGEAAQTAFEKAQVTEACIAMGRNLADANQPAGAERVLLALRGKDKSPHVQCAVVEALGLVSDDEAEKIVNAAAHSSDGRLRTSAIEGLRQAASQRPKRAFRLAAWEARLKDAPEETRIRFMKAMADEMGYCANPITASALKEKSPQLRKGAVEAMGLMTGKWASFTVPALLKLLTEANKDILPETVAALSTVVNSENRPKESAELEGEIAGRLPNVYPDARAALLALLASRMAVAQLPAVLKAAEDKDEAARAAAIRAVGALGGAEKVPAVVGWLRGAGSDAIRAAAEEALVTMGRSGTAGQAAAAAAIAAVAKAQGPVKLALVRALGAMQQDAGLGVLRREAFGSDAALKEAGVRALADWPTAAAAEDLLKVATSGSPDTLAVLALRGYVRLVNAPGAPEDAEGKLKMCRAAMSAAKRPDEKRAVLGVLGRLPAAGAAEMAAACMDDAALARDAAAALVGAARGLNEITPAIRAGLEKVVATSKDKRQVGEAMRALERGRK